MFVVVDQIKKNNELDDNVEYNLDESSVSTDGELPNTGRLTVRRDTPTISFFCFQWATSFLNANISKLGRIVRASLFE